MGDFSHPKKKLRLDDAIDTLDWELPGNDDLWGQDELTAEEFDLLEIQATQATEARDSMLNVSQVAQTASSNVSGDHENENTKWETFKQEQYALEGKNKTLTDMLEKTKTELNEERSSREQIIDQKLAQFKQKEADLLKEIDKLKTALTFQKHDVITERFKFKMVESKLKEKTKEVQLYTNSSGHKRSMKLSPPRRSSTKLLHWNSFGHESRTKTAESGIQTETARYRRFSLSLQAPRGEPRGNDAVCKLLSCRIVDSFVKSDPVCSSENYPNTINEIFKRTRDSSSMSITMLRCRKESESVWKPYETVLEEYINRLKTEQNSPKLDTQKMSDSSVEDKCHSGLNCQQSSIVTCLRDLTRLLFHQCPKETSINFDDTKFENKNDLEVYNANSMPLFGDEDKTSIVQRCSPRLAEFLVMLASPTTYPDGHKKTDEIEWALAALVAWSSQCKESLESCIQDLPLHSVVSGQYGMGCAYMAIKFMVQLIGLKSFKQALIHHSDSCILCSIGDLCQCIHDNPGNLSTLLMNVIEDFLSGVLTCYGFAIIKKKSRPCSSEVVQGVIIMLLKQLQFDEKCDLPRSVAVMKKGITLLFFIASHLPNFRTSRMPVNENYVALICGLSKLRKENPEFKKFRNIIRDLWDFQDDSSEFESDEARCP